jgi:hypothetical protein
MQGGAMTMTPILKGTAARLGLRKPKPISARVFPPGSYASDPLAVGLAAQMYPLWSELEKETRTLGESLATLGIKIPRPTL